MGRRTVWDGSDVIADSTAGDSGWRYRIPFGLNAIAEAQKDSTGAWKFTYVVSDPVGTPEMLLDDSGNVVGRYAFGPFGELEDYQGSRTVEFLYGGREWDGDLAAGVFGYRLYDPESGQFLSTDPMDQFWSPYSYVGGSPLDGMDPWGLETGLCADAPVVIPGASPQYNTSTFTLPALEDLVAPGVPHAQSSGFDFSTNPFVMSPELIRQFRSRFPQTLNLQSSAVQLPSDNGYRYQPRQRAKGITVFAGRGYSLATPVVGVTGEVGIFISFSTSPDAGMYFTRGQMAGIASGKSAKSMYRGSYWAGGVVSGGTDNFSGTFTNYSVSTKYFGATVHQVGDGIAGGSISTGGSPGFAISTTYTDTRLSFGRWMNAIAKGLVRADHQIVDRGY